MKKALNTNKIKKAFGERVSPLLRGAKMPKNNKLRGAVFGVSGATISRWCSGIDMPDTANCCAIADYFDVSVDWLLLGREPRYDYFDTKLPALSQIYPQLNADMAEKVESLMLSLIDQQREA